MKVKDKTRLNEKIVHKRVSNPKDVKGKGWIMYEYPRIYDGWCAMGNTITKEVILRDAWFIGRMEEGDRIKLIEGIRRAISPKE